MHPLVRTALVIILQTRKRVYIQEDNKILISRFMCEDHGRGVIGGGLISGKKFTRCARVAF